MNKADIHSLNDLYLLIEASKGPPYIKIDSFGNKFYFKDKEMKIFHREDGPAIEWSDGSKSWWLNGKCHRVDGPAYEGSNGIKEWWINGKKLTEDEFKASKEHRAYLATKQYNQTIKRFDGKGDVEGDFNF